MIRCPSFFGGLLAITFIVVVSIVSIFALQKIKVQTTVYIRNSLQTVLQTVRDSHQIWITERNNGLLIISETPKMLTATQALLDLHRQKLPLVRSEPENNIIKLLSPLLKKHMDKGFFLIAPDRKTIVSSFNIESGTTNLLHEQQKALLDKAFSGVISYIHSINLHESEHEYFIEEGDHTDATFLALPIRNHNSKVIAVFAIYIDPFFQLSRITKLGRLGETGETYAFDKNGILITESRFDHHLRMINVIGPGEVGKFNMRIADPGGNLLTGYLPEIKKEQFPLTKMAVSALQGGSGYDIEGYRDYRGVTVFGAWTWDEKYQFGITTEIDKAEALEPYYQTRDTFLAVVFATCLLVISMVCLIFRSQIRSKQQLLQANQNLENSVQERTNDLQAAKQALSRANKELTKLATTDGLTGLFNRRHFFNLLEVEWQRCIRDKKTISIIIFDIDYFKPFNDTYGHIKGDECLVKVSSVLRTGQFTNRPGDVIARYGGEEFIVLLSDADSQYAAKVAELIRNEIANLHILHEGSKVENTDFITVSLGYVSSYDLERLTPKQFIDQADQALYKAKNSGRNNSMQF
ncbi:MAG: GGDEF domain-containing protein [Saccharospirillaceae bacterium]|nr:diguanylate cyclase [Pseudomonadales bacterium]NRB81610.1 GGDEF domain-containing protein [Saccharospirillaceae bacterium]